MERALQKLAQQLNQYDASSLTGLWERYAQTVARFEPTRRWEEAVLAFCMIQAVHWKNQLFNCGMIENQQRAEQNRELERQLKDKLGALSARPEANGKAADACADKSGGTAKNGNSAGTGGKKPQRRKVLVFPSARDSGKS